MIFNVLSCIFDEINEETLSETLKMASACEYCVCVHLNSDFGDLSKRLADAWKQLPEGDKQVPNVIVTHNAPVCLPC